MDTINNNLEQESVTVIIWPEAIRKSAAQIIRISIQTKTIKNVFYTNGNNVYVFNIRILLKLIVNMQCAVFLHTNNDKSPCML